jgi:hypothetical protein
LLCALFIAIALFIHGSPLSVVGQGMFCSNSFHVPDVSLVPDLTMQLLSAGQITDHDCHVILDPDFCYIQDRQSLTGFVFLPLHLPVLSDLLSLLHSCHCFISGIIVWVIIVDLDSLLCFDEVF